MSWSGRNIVGTRDGSSRGAVSRHCTGAPRATRRDRRFFSKLVSETSCEPPRGGVELTYADLNGRNPKGIRTERSAIGRQSRSIVQRRDPRGVPSGRTDGSGGPTEFGNRSTRTHLGGRTNSYLIRPPYNCVDVPRPDTLTSPAAADRCVGCVGRPKRSAHRRPRIATGGCGPVSPRPWALTRSAEAGPPSEPGRGQPGRNEFPIARVASRGCAPGNPALGPARCRERPDGGCARPPGPRPPPRRGGGPPILHRWVRTPRFRRGAVRGRGRRRGSPGRRTGHGYGGEARRRHGQPGPPSLRKPRLRSAGP